MKACLIFTVNLLCNNGQDFLDTQYIEINMLNLKDIVI